MSQIRVQCFDYTIVDISLDVKKAYGERNKLYTKEVVGHYLKNNLFFFVGCYCAILGGSKDHCIILTYLILITKIAEIVGVFFGFLWVCYICHALGALINYVNICTAINYFT